MTIPEYCLAGLLLATVMVWLADHVRRLRDVERKLNLILAHLEIDPKSSVRPSRYVSSLAADPQQRMAAIKAYRSETGAGLKEAASMIEKIASRRDGTSS